MLHAGESAKHLSKKRRERLLISMSQTKFDIQLNVPRLYEDTSHLKGLAWDDDFMHFAIVRTDNF